MAKSLTRRMVIAAAVLGSTLPLSLSPTGRIEVTTAACADGTCCYQKGSLCIINGEQTKEAYWSGGAGPCPSKPTDPAPPP